MTALALAIRPESPEDAGAIRRLHERAFGPGRFARTAFRLREGVADASDLCFTATVGTLLVGSVRLLPVVIGSEVGLMLGPLAVDPAFDKRGIGTALVERSLEAARTAGHRLVILVGDEPYYGRFGFRRVLPGRLLMPGPVDPSRLLILGLLKGVAEAVRGRVGPAR